MPTRPVAGAALTPRAATKPLLVVAALGAAVATLARHRQAQNDAEILWREATSDASH